MVILDLDTSISRFPTEIRLSMLFYHLSMNVLLTETDLVSDYVYSPAQARLAKALTEGKSRPGTEQWQPLRGPAPSPTVSTHLPPWAYKPTYMSLPSLWATGGGAKPSHLLLSHTPRSSGKKLNYCSGKTSEVGLDHSQRFKQNSFLCLEMIGVSNFLTKQRA